MFSRMLSAHFLLTQKRRGAGLLIDKAQVDKSYFLGKTPIGSKWIVP